MKYLPSLILALLASPALSHPSVVAHEHPHGASALLGVDTIAVTVLMIALGIYAVKILKGR